jgi:hypothetical protein
VQGSDVRSRRPLGFPPGTTVDVRQVDDQDWATLRALEYQANSDYFKVPITACRTNPGQGSSTGISGAASDKYPIYGGRVGLRALCATG